MGTIPDITIKDYLVVLQQAHAALNAIEKTCLKDRDLRDKLTEADWECIRATYSGVIGERGRPPMTGSC